MINILYTSFKNTISVKNNGIILILSPRLIGLNVSLK